MILVYNSQGFVQQTLGEPVDDDYAGRLSVMGLRLARVPDDYLSGRSLADVWVDPQSSRPAFREPLPVTISRTAIAADGKRLATITSIPPKTTVRVDGTPHLIDDGRLDLVSTMPADYRIEIDRWPYLPWSATITVR